MVQVAVGSNILSGNDLQAKQNRSLFDKKGILVINLMSSPGAGKTTLLERTIENLKDKVKIGVIEGDLYTDFDARRIEKKGIRVKQINTVGACHLNADMIIKVLPELGLDELELLVIENVGNLVCPVEFDLGEDLKIVVTSTTEGNDKVHKYPLIFREANSIILNKLDLLSYTDFDLDRFKMDVARVNVLAPVFAVSCKSDIGISNWCEWLLEEVRGKKLKSMK